MSEPINDGGCAFPVSRSHFTADGNLLSADWVSGMSLRAFIATKQLAAITTAAAFNQDAEEMMKKAGIDVTNGNLEKFFASMAVNFADALIAELKKGAAK